MAGYSAEDKAHLASLLGGSDPAAFNEGPDASYSAQNQNLTNLDPQTAALLAGRPKPGQTLVPPGSVPGSPAAPSAQPAVPPGGSIVGGIPMGPPTSFADIARQQAVTPSPAGQGLSHAAPTNLPLQRGGPMPAPRPDMSRVVTANPQAAGGAAQMQGTPPPAARQPPYMGGPARPAGLPPTQFLETMAPEQRKQIEEGRKEEEEGQYKLALAQSNQHEGQAEVYRAAQTKADAFKDEQDELNRQMQATIDHYGQIQERAAKGPQHIDPNHFFSSKSAFENITLRIAMAMSAAGAALSHGTDSVAMMVQKGIDADINAQVQDIENNRNGLRDEQSLVADKWRMFGDKQKAIASAKQEQWQYADTEAKRVAEQSQSQQALANYQVFHGKAMQEYGAQDAVHNKYVPPKVGAGPMTAKQLLDLEKETADIEHVRGETAHLGDKGQRANSVGVKAEEQADARHSILRDLDELDALRKEAGVTGLWDPYKRARAESLESQIALHYNPAHGIQRIGARPELEDLKHKVVPDVARPGLPGARAGRIQALREEFQGESDEDKAAAPAGTPAFNVGSFKKVGGR